MSNTIKIKDENFLKLLRTKKYKSALRNEAGKPDVNGEFLDKSSPAVLNKTSLDIRSQFAISDLSGIEVFENVEALKIDSYHLKAFPVLPPKVKTLTLKGRAINEMPPLPSSLENLNLNWVCKTLSLPENLISFNCFNAGFKVLPTLPASLKQLNCESNKLKELPALPGSLEKIDCSDNQMAQLPELPSSLTALHCSNNNLTSIPLLPDELTHIDCSDNKIDHIQNIPKNVKSFICCNNRLPTLPEFPEDVFVNFKGNKSKKTQSFFCGKDTDNYNLKLVVVEELMRSDHGFEEELLSQSEKGNLEPYLLSLNITKKQLAKITRLCFDGGHKIYSVLDSSWDGEDDIYDIASLNGIEELKNLEEIEFISMVDESATWKPLLKLKKLKSFLNPEICDVADQLHDKGVTT